MRRLHGPFDPVSPRAHRSNFRRRIIEAAREGICECGICESRRNRGDDPHGAPPEVDGKIQAIWARLPHPNREGEPPMNRQVWLCERPGVEL